MKELKLWAYIIVIIAAPLVVGIGLLVATVSVILSF